MSKESKMFDLNNPKQKKHYENGKNLSATYQISQKETEPKNKKKKNL